MEQTHAFYLEAVKAMEGLYGKDVPMSLATSEGEKPNVRVVDVYFENGAFYTVTYRKSNKMREIALNPHVALNHLLFVARGTAADIGHPLAKGNEALRETLMGVFEKFYSRHVDEHDPDTCILKITPAWALVFTDDSKYIADFITQTASRQPFVNDILV